MTTQPPAATLSVSDRKAAWVARQLVQETSQAIVSANSTLPDGFTATPDSLALAAVRAVLRGLGTHAGHWVHMTDFAVFATWVECIDMTDPTTHSLDEVAAEFGIDLNNEKEDKQE